MIENRIVKTELIKWREIKPLQPDNLKHIFNYKYIEDSILTHGFSMPFFVWQNGDDIFAVDGHSRIEVLNNLENVPEQLPATFINAKNRKEAIEILLEVFNQKHNPIGSDVLIEWVNIEQINVNIDSLNVKIEDLDIVPEVLEAVEDDFDTAPPTTPITVLGDLYEIGEHRLLCGDSTCSDTVAKLMNGNKADMVFTDPPYGVDFVGIKGTMYQNGKKKGKDSYEAIKNDDLKNESLTDLFYESISNAIINTKSNSTFYIFFGINKSKETIEAISNLDLEIRNWLIWDKGNVGFHAMGAQYKPNYESFLYCFKKGSPPNWIGNQQQQTIWRHSLERIGLHPTMKPISLISQAIQNHDALLLLDLFLGSGSTMVASHQLKRKCYGLELDPKYCDVIVKRMIKLDHTLTIKRNGVKIDIKEFD